MISGTKQSRVFDHDTTCARISVLIITFIFGMALGAQLVGSRLFLGDRPSSRKSIRKIILSGSIHRLSDTPLRNTSHKDDNGRQITKQQFLEPFLIPNVAGYSVATLLPGQRVAPHQHSTMHEFFYILEGTGVFTIDGKDTQVEPGTFLHVAPHEIHEIVVPSDSSTGEMKMLVSGVVVEDRYDTL